MRFKKNKVIKKINYFFKEFLRLKELIIINYLNSIKNKRKIYLIEKYQKILKGQ